VDDRTDGGRPKKSLPMTTGDLDDYDEELDDGDTEDDGGLEDKVKTVPVLFAGNPPRPPQVSTALFGLTEVFGSTTGGKTQG
jgi:hypothetical protein